jgi:adenosylcobinamide-phosphate synthase
VTGAVRSAGAVRSSGAGWGLIIDALIGDPPTPFHPVAWFGRLAGAVESRTYGDRRTAGAVHAASLVGGAAVVGRLLRSTAPAVAVSSSGRTLAVKAREVAMQVHAGNLAAARETLPWLVGRDPGALDPAGICRAAVESVAENSVDAVVAPWWWAIVAGSPGVAAHRAANTLDAMVGHHNDRFESFGWASARLDDVMAYVPARLTALAVMAVRPTRAHEVLATIGRDGSLHPSPNAGVAESAWAAVLDVSLGGPLIYDGEMQDRPWLGSGRRDVTPYDVIAATRLLRDVELALVATSFALSRWSRRNPTPSAPARR